VYQKYANVTSKSYFYQHNVRLTSEPLFGAEFAQASAASRKLRDNRLVWFKRLLG
jgi:hypothetical protein